MCISRALAFVFPLWKNSVFLYIDKVTQEKEEINHAGEGDKGRNKRK